MNPAGSHERKLCPNCGHSNRATVKNCTQCGYAFLNRSGATILRKRCETCGHMNRMGANRCTQCGTPFQSKTATVQAQAQKWCPQCGNQRRPIAKVCSFCGYRFKPPVADPASAKPASAEKPIVQTDALGTPITFRTTASSPPTPKVPDLSGEPAPYISQDELERLRKMGTQDPGLFVRLYHVLRDNKT